MTATVGEPGGRLPCSEERNRPRRHAWGCSLTGWQLNLDDGARLAQTDSHAACAPKVAFVHDCDVPGDGRAAKLRENGSLRPQRRVAGPFLQAAGAETPAHFDGEQVHVHGPETGAQE